MNAAKSMTDHELFALIREADPPAESFPPAAAESEGERVLSEILACDRSEPERVAPARRHRRRLMLGAASGVGLAGGAAASALALLAGSTPALAEAFPVFAKPPVEVSLQLPGNRVEVFKDARAIATPYGTGYIATAVNESELCVAIPSAAHSPWVSGPVYSGRCEAIGPAEQHGFVLDTSLALPGHNGLGEHLQSAPEIVAVLPAGVSDATVHNADGSSTPLAAEDGIVATVEQHAATITYQAGGEAVSFQVAPESGSTPGTTRLPSAWRPPARSTATPTGATATGGDGPVTSR